MAKTVEALITPEVLKWVRERRIRLSIEYAAKKLNVKPARLRAWEAGTEKPTFAQLKKIAKLYKTHISVFYLPEPPAGFSLVADYRKLPESLTTDEEQAYKLNANIIEAYERREALLEFYELLEEPPFEVTLELSEDDTPEQAAQKTNNFLQLERELLRQSDDQYAALKFWKQTVEARGILVCQTSANSHLSIDLETVRGFCIVQKPFPVIIINPKDSPYGRIFTILHELVHIALGKSIVLCMEDEEDRSEDWSQTEVFCNEVAAAILVPAAELSEKVNLPTLATDLPQLSKHFRVSAEVIMRRLQTLAYISPEDYQEYRNNLLEKYIDSSPSGGLVPYHNKLLNASGEHFARTAFTAYHEQKITLADLSAVFSRCDTKHLPKIESVIFA